MKPFLKKTFLLALLSLPSSIGLNAQITLKIDGKTATEAVKQIEKSSEYRFFYNKGGTHANGLNY